MKILKNDTVLIISGKDNGKKGKVLRALPKEGMVLVEGANLIKKHQKPKKGGEKGQVIQLPGPIAISSVELVCPKCGKAARVGYRTTEEKKYRICKKCDQEI
ncbi:MAG: 50S ribosomal protein L24 [bacterium]|nr:50S ribosomal protein L24 [bacterium]